MSDTQSITWGNSKIENISGRYYVPISLSGGARAVVTGIQMSSVSYKTKTATGQTYLAPDIENVYPTINSNCILTYGVWLAPPTSSTQYTDVNNKIATEVVRLSCGPKGGGEINVATSSAVKTMPYEVSIPNKIFLGPGESFSAVCGPYNIVVIKEDGT